MPKNRLLLIEDDFDVAEMLVMYFEAIHYEVIHADTGKGGIEIASRKFPHLILLDVMLPDMDGYDVCVALRKRALTRYIPILFLTQIDERSSKVKGLTLGADDYITKPFDIDELRLRVESCIRRATREHLHEPRTGLPTGPLVREELERRRGADCTELRLSLAGFQEYADVYSFLAANDVMFHAARMLRDVISDIGTRDDFVGIEKNDFVLATYSSNPNGLEEELRRRFADSVRAFYTFADAERGGMLLSPGNTDERFIPLMNFIRASSGERV
jgi:DNA-binding response OmpR family regulator